MTTIGLKFGNTSSSISSLISQNKIEIIGDEDGQRYIPTIVSFSNNDVFHGEQARLQLIKNSENTITNFTSLYCKKYDNCPLLISKFQTASKPIKRDDDGIAYNIRYQGVNRVFSVEEIVKYHFQYLKKTAENFLGKKIDGVVITVPSDYNYFQKEELKKLCESIDLKVFQIILESSSSLLTHLTFKPNGFLEDKLYAVFDYGGTKSECSIISVKNGIMTKTYSSTEFGLGGDIFDFILLDYFSCEFEKMNNIDIKKNRTSFFKLLSEVLSVKKTLSNVKSSNFSIESLINGIDFSMKMSRLTFEFKIKSELNKMIEFAKNSIISSGFDFLEIDEILLTGGTSYIPRLVTQISNLFSQKSKIISTHNNADFLFPTDFVIYGSALQASLIKSLNVQQINELNTKSNMNVLHVTKSIGINTSDDEFISIIPFNSVLPIEKSIKLSKKFFNDSVISLCEGKKVIVEKKNVKYQETGYSSNDEDLIQDKEIVYVKDNLIYKTRLESLKEESDLFLTLKIDSEGILDFILFDPKSKDVVFSKQIHPNTLIFKI